MVRSLAAVLALFAIAFLNTLQAKGTPAFHLDSATSNNRKNQQQQLCHTRRQILSGAAHCCAFMSTKESGNENETGASSMLHQTSTMIAKMAAYFDSMVDRRNDRFYYRCLPNSGTKIHGHCPIRDLGSAWDTTNLLRSSSTAAGPSKNLSQQYPHLAKAVTSTIHAYVPKDMSWQTFTNARDQPCAALPSRLLLEPSNVAHSAFFILALTGALQLELFESSPPNIPLDALVNGILSMQQEETGAFAIHFEDKQHDIFRGIEFYPGEAMLAVLDAYQEVPDLLSPTTRQSIVPAVQRAFLFKLLSRRQCGRALHELLWQLAGAVLWKAT